MSKSQATPKTGPGPHPALVAKATDTWKQKSEADFCANLEMARTMWRRYRSMVEAPDYPEHLLASFESEYERLPDDSSELAGEEIFSPDFKKDCLTRGTQTARDWAKADNPPTKAVDMPTTTAMAHDPGIRVYGLEEEPDFITLTKKQALSIRRLALLASEEGEPEPHQCTQEEQKENVVKSAAYEKAAQDLDGMTARIRQLNIRDKECVLALLELLEFGDGGIEHGSWVLSIVREFLSHVAWEGPGPANELPFAQTLLAQIVAYDYFESWIDDARWLAGRYPGLLQFAPKPASKGATP